MNKKTFLLIFAIFFLIIPGYLQAQAAEELEAMLGTGVVSCEQAARYVLGSAGTSFHGSAFDHAVSRGWIKKSKADDPVTLGKLSFLIMQAFKIKGGMMYSMIPSPRYAYRSMVSRNFIQGAADPAMTVNGDRFMIILGRVLNKEDNI